MKRLAAAAAAAGSALLVAALAALKVELGLDVAEEEAEAGKAD